MRTVFFGTPAFAVPSLRALLGEGFPIAAVVTQPDKPIGRSRSRAVSSPVKLTALDESIEVLQPETPADPEFTAALRALQPDIGVVVAYGHILKPALLGVPRLGMINVHASLLPALRGAAPIHYAILNGLNETGVSIIQMEKGMDSGPVLMQVPTPIAEDETTGELTVRLAETGALALVEALTLIGSGAAQPTEQDHSRATFAPKVSRETARIRWDRPAAEIVRLVRAMDPTPGAWTELDGLGIKLYGARLVNLHSDHPNGAVLAVNGNLAVSTADGLVQFMDIQPAGRKRMSTPSWLRGRPKDEAVRFG